MSIKIIAKNKRAFFDYFIEEKFEAGIVLVGTEVKTLRTGKVSLGESYISIDRNNEAWIYQMTIPHYEFGNINNHEETRKRKLLLHSSEITKIAHSLKAGGYTVVPTMIYFSKSNIKVEIGLGKGKQLHDKRNDQAKKDVNRKLQRGIYE